MVNFVYFCRETGISRFVEGRGYIWANQAKQVQCPVREIFASVGHVTTQGMVYLHQMNA